MRRYTAIALSLPRPAQRGEGRVRGISRGPWRSDTKTRDMRLRGFARQMRQNRTDAENKFWRLLRLRSLGGHKFRRQHPIGPYIVDFCSPARKLVIELDGGLHAESARYDRQRTKFLQSLGFRVLRVWDNEALNNTNGVLEKVLETLEEEPLTLPSPRFTGRGKEKAET